MSEQSTTITVKSGSHNAQAFWSGFHTVPESIVNKDYAGALEVENFGLADGKLTLINTATYKNDKPVPSDVDVVNTRLVTIENRAIFNRMTMAPAQVFGVVCSLGKHNVMLNTLGVLRVRGIDSNMEIRFSVQDNALFYDLLNMQATNQSGSVDLPVQVTVDPEINAPQTYTRKFALALYTRLLESPPIPLGMRGSYLIWCNLMYRDDSDVLHTTRLFESNVMVFPHKRFVFEAVQESHV